MGGDRAECPFHPGLDPTGGLVEPGVASARQHGFYFMCHRIHYRIDWSSVPRRSAALALILVAAALGLGVPPGVTQNSRAAEDGPLRSRAKEFEGRKAGDPREVSGVKLCWCPAGRFVMGAPRGEPKRRTDEDQVEVTLTQGFWMGK